jgi:hypothetical protein
MLLKYRPEDKAAKKERLLKRAQAETEGKTVEAVVTGTTARAVGLSSATPPPPAGSEGEDPVLFSLADL